MISVVDRDEFWRVIALARRRSVGRPNRVAAGVMGRLERRPLDEILSFGRQYYTVTAEANTWLLWAAAYLINGGCSNDGFDYFRGWLVTRGRDAWTRAVADPDSLADVVRSGWLARMVRAVRPLECENMLGVASDAYERATGDHQAYWAALNQQVADPELDLGTQGETFDFDDDAQMRARLPRLSARLIH